MTADENKVAGFGGGGSDPRVVLVTRGTGGSGPAHPSGGRDANVSVTYDPQSFSISTQFPAEDAPPLALTDQHIAELERAIRREGYDIQIDTETGEIHLVKSLLQSS